MKTLGEFDVEKPLGRLLDLGQHRVFLDADIVVVQIKGAVSAKEAEDLMAFVVRWDLALGNLGMLVFTAGEFSLSPEARRALVESAKRDIALIPMAAVGTGIVTRTIFTLLINAIRLTIRTQVPVRFAASEAEARTWLGEQMSIRSSRIANKAVR